MDGSGFDISGLVWLIGWLMVLCVGFALVALGIIEWRSLWFVVAGMAVFAFGVRTGRKSNA